MSKILKNIIFILVFYNFLICQCEDYFKGDLNNDNLLNIMDVVIMVDFIFEGNNTDTFFQTDINNDNIINILDLVVLVNRILDDYPQEVNLSFINYDFNNTNVIWESSSDYGFLNYNLYYSNFFDNEEELLYTTSNILDTNIVLPNLELKEQNFFWITVEDFLGCELIGQQFLYELPYKDYSLDDNGHIVETEFNINDFSPSIDCYDCHSEHYEEWFSSMHSHTMKSELFFSYKEQSKVYHPETGEKFCMQCHNPVSYLTGEDLSQFNNPNALQNSEFVSQVLKDGIGCDVCHTITGLSQTVHSGGNFAANAVYKLFPTGNIKFGPIQNPENNDYHDSYYLPTYESSQTCLPCHDLVINDIEAEITFTEWNRIPGFSMFGGVSCQECHMPVKDNGYHDHKFIGVDLDLSIPLSENPLFNDVQDLLSTSAEINFTINEDTLSNSISPGDILQIPLTVTSLTAHNLPSGTSFNRQAWLEIKIYNNNDLIYSSGVVENSQPLDTSDNDLLLFTSFLYDEYGNETNDITNFVNMDNFTLAPYQDRYKIYNVQVSDSINGNLDISARLLFRPFKPSFILSHHPEFLENLPVYEIDSIFRTVEVLND